MKPQAPQNIESLGSQFLPIQEYAGTSRFLTKKNIFGDREIGRQVQFLINNRDAFCLGFRRIREFDGFSVKLNGSRIRLVNSGDDLHQGAFPGAILPHHRVDAPLLNFERNVLQSLDAGKTLRNSLYLEDRFGEGVQDLREDRSIGALEY